MKTTVVRSVCLGRGVLAGLQDRAGRTADWLRRDLFAEKCPAAGEEVKVRGQAERTAIEPERVPALLVGEKYNEIVRGLIVSL